LTQCVSWVWPGTGGLLVTTLLWPGQTGLAFLVSLGTGSRARIFRAENWSWSFLLFTSTRRVFVILLI